MHLNRSHRKVPTLSRTLDLQSYVPALVTLLANRLTNSGSAIYRQELGVGATEMRVIVILGSQPDISGIRIGTITGLDKAAVSRALRTLEALGLITIKADPEHGRRQSIALTAAGRLLHDRGVVLSLERENRLLESFTSRERKLVISLLNRMLTNMPAVESIASEADA